MLEVENECLFNPVNGVITITVYEVDASEIVREQVLEFTTTRRLDDAKEPDFRSRFRVTMR